MKRSTGRGPDSGSLPESTDSVVPNDSTGRNQSLVPAGVALPNWVPVPQVAESPVLTVDARLMHDLATRALAAGGGGLTKVGVVSAGHGEGTTTIARSLAACLAENFGQRVVLVEANQRSPCLAHVCGLTPGPGLSAVLAGTASLESALRVSGPAGKILVLPACLPPSLNTATLPATAWRDLAAELFFYADALVLDLAPLLPYPDSLAISRALDGVALVMRAGLTKRADSARAIEALKRTSVPVLGAVLNRERRYVPRFLERML